MESESLPIPSVQQLLLPTLISIDDKCTFDSLDTWISIARMSGLTEGDLQRVLSNGQAIRFANRISACLTRLRRKRFIHRLRRSVYVPTVKWQQFLDEVIELDKLIPLYGYQLRHTTPRITNVNASLLLKKLSTRSRDEDAGETTDEPDHHILSKALGVVFHDGNWVQFSVHYEPELGMNESFASALYKYAECTTCGSPPEVFFCTCTCFRRKSNRQGAYPSYRVKESVWNQILSPLAKKDTRRAYDRRSRDSRREAIDESKEAPYTRSDINVVREIQGNACYYCGTSIDSYSQIDHLQPLSKGGSNGLKNIMLACPSCNRSKYNFTEAEFWRRLRRRMSYEEYVPIREAAKKMKKEKSQYIRAGLFPHRD